MISKGCACIEKFTKKLMQYNFALSIQFIPRTNWLFLFFIFIFSNSDKLREKKNRYIYLKKLSFSIDLIKSTNYKKKKKGFLFAKLF